MRRTHERVLAEGTFRLVLTDRHQLVAALHAVTALGPVHVVVRVNHALRLDPRRAELERALYSHDVGYEYAYPDHDVGFIKIPKIKIKVPGFVKDVANVAEKAFKVATTVAPFVAAPALGIVHQAAQGGAHAIAQTIPMLAPDAAKKFEAATRIMAKSKIGDLGARKFIGKVVDAAKKQIPGARQVANTLLDAHRFIDRTTTSIDQMRDELTNPTKKAERLLSAMKKGDWKAVEKMARAELSNLQGAVSMIPGLGTAVSAGLGAGLAALEGGHPLEIAIRTAYGAIPIPPGVRQITDAALDAVLSLALRGESVTEAAVAAARNAVPEGPAREVFDTLMKIVVKRVPIERAGVDLLEQYVQRYGGVALQAIPLPASPEAASRLLLPANVDDPSRMLGALHHATPEQVHHATRMLRPLHLAPGQA